MQQADWERSAHRVVIQRQRGGPQAAAELAQAIYADPRDDDLRRVYADLLLDAGDVRGEMIHLQLEEEPSEEATQRLEALLQLHSDRWLGSLSGWIERVRFERGFPARAALTHRALAEEIDAADPSWSTIEELTLPFRNVDTDAFLERVQRLLASPVMRSLRSLREVSVEVAEALATIETLAVERMHLADVRALDGYDVACDRLLAALARGFPALRVLELGGRMPVDRVERLRLALEGRIEVVA